MIFERIQSTASVAEEVDDKKTRVEFDKLYVSLGQESNSRVRRHQNILTGVKVTRPPFTRLLRVRFPGREMLLHRPMSRPNLCLSIFTF